MQEGRTRHTIAPVQETTSAPAPESSAGRLSVAPPARWRWAALWLALGALLRAALIFFPRQRDDDTDAYLELGRNLFHHGTYGFMDDGVVSPALFRLPGYPIFLELLGGHMRLVFLVQSLIDMAGCLLLAGFLRRYVSERAALAVLALSGLCFFTATYACAALTESLSIFAVAAAIAALGALLARPDAFAATGWLRRLLALAASAALAMLLRPDGALLPISLAIALGWYGWRRAGAPAAARTACLFTLLACLPLAPWAIRNAVTFHVFQPLAPRHVNDPGERVNTGFYDWLRTWSVEFQTTANVFWKVGTEPIRMENLPARAFDSDAQRARTAALLATYNQTKDISPELDARFETLAQERIRTHPLRTFVWVPALRVADMWLRPRTEGIPLSLAWWRWREHPGESATAIALGLFNLGYLLLALAGATRRPPLAVFLATYLLLRCLLLATLENPEPRYTLEAFPIVFVLGAVWLGREVRRSAAI